MTYTLRQVQTLLTKPELELFQASRTAAVKDIAPHRLASKIQRTRALRDKYRDVYQRQTVQTRASDPRSHQPLGNENARTLKKSEVMDEVLKRFEAQQEKLQRQQDAVPPTSKSRPRTPRAQPAPRKTAKTTARATAAKASTKKPAAKKSAAKKSPSKKSASKKPELSVAALAQGVKRLQNIVKAVRKAVVADTKASDAR